ncbi:GLUG motif-containing protein [Sulfurospirillum sp. UCH001]|uniref:beta strand repeat-containing protein n=1 Tax=Sulfurospirillum sp. UCH001 TaxID=1581011 RepID=UPI00082FBAF5|nr:GLUG motif-containing protein [Sulfurospirillum sp. UCH001]
MAGYAGGGSYEMYDGEAQYSNFPTISNVTVNNFTYSHTKEFTVDTQNINTEVSNIGAVAGYIDGATLSNLLATGSITANLIANNYNEFENSYSTVGIHDIGGLFGNIYNSSLNTASSNVAITATLTNQTAHDSIETYDIGGLSGGAGNSIFQNTTASGNISITHANDDNGVSYAGSIGGAFGSIYNSYVKTSSTTNAITVSGAITEGIESVGGFAGDSGYSVYDTVSTSGVMNIIVTGNNVYSAGGLLGTSYNDIVKNVTSTRNITLSADYVEYIGGLIGGTEYSNIDMATYTGTLDLSSVNNGESVGGLVGYSYGEIDDHTQVYFSKVVSAATTPDNQAQIDAVKTALLTAFNARADVVALKAMGYTVEDNSWGNDNEPYYVKFNLKSPSMEWGVIQNATAIVDIKAPNVENVGGLVGYMDSYDGGQIINSSVASLGGTGKVLGGTNVGGLVGYNSYGNITDSHAAIEVVGNTDYDGSYVGGLVGYNEGGSRGQDVYPYIQDSYSYAELSFANQSDAEAKLAQIQDIFITNALATNPGYEMNYNGLYVAFDGTNYVVGGSLGLYKSTSTGTITNSYATGRVTGSSNVGGLVGYNYGEDGGAAITNSYASGVVVGTDNVGGLVGYNEYAMLDTVYATGTVNGNNKVGGLVGYATGSEIIDSHHTLGKVTGTENDSAEGGRIGGLVGLLEESSLSNSYATSEVVGETVVGGLVGIAMGSQIVDSYVTGKVTASGGTGNDLSTYGFDANEYISMAGGFVGIASQSSIENSYATGEVVGKGILGGFAGGLQVTEVSGSHATGKVTGTNGLGGFVGFSIISNISQSYSTGVVDATAVTGVDSVTAGNMVGGFIGRSLADTISESYTASNVTGATNVGGFVGKVSDAATIRNTYARGGVTASGNNVGSFAGSLDGSTVENSYASGKINQTGLNQLSVKGFVGNHDGDIINSFYDKTVNAGLTDDGSNVGKTTTELKTQSTYTTALGDGAWNMGGENGHYPILGFQVDGAESIWVMAEGPMPVDPTPVPTPSTPIVETPKIIDAIASGIAVQPPVVPNFTPPPLPSIPQQFSFGGQAVQLMSTPLGEIPTQIISLGEIRQMQQENASGAEGVKSPDIRIPLGQNSLIQLVNGGLRLPEGIEQEFFMAQR